KSWLWADHRAAALDLPQLGGLDVGEWDEEREPGVWRRVLEVLDGRVGAVSATATGGEVHGKRRFEEVEGSAEDKDEEEDDDDDEAVIEVLVSGEGLDELDELGHDGGEGGRNKRARMDVKGSRKLTN
ncbi:MAG: hypothetical protein LQ346_007369, partial [Caloplaca aetnensis]